MFRASKDEFQCPLDVVPGDCCKKGKGVTVSFISQAGNRQIPEELCASQSLFGRWRLLCPRRTVIKMPARKRFLRTSQHLCSCFEIFLSGLLGLQKAQVFKKRRGRALIVKGP